MTSYPHLFSPLPIGNVESRNRILQTAHSKQFSHEGVDSQRNLDYQVERAKGGIGLIITGNRFVHPSSSAGAPRFSWGFLRKAVDVDRRITSAVHEHGALIVAQLNHFGVNGSSDSVDDLRLLWGPSDIPSPGYNETPRPMSHADIREVIDWWALSAELSRDGGFDGVEVHLSHAYLLHQFLSPLYNAREDEYGGSLENRLRFAREVIAAVRSRVGRDFVVGTRIPLTDAVEGGLTIEDAVEIARVLEADGAIDYINVTAGGYHDGLFNAIATSDREGGWLVDLTAQVRAAVTSVPVFVVGGLSDPGDAEAILAAGKADMVALTRAQIADPNWASKVREGREDEVYRCIRGNQGCINRSFLGLPIACTVNPAAGREGRFGTDRIEAAATPGRWVVVGGGPGGLKAAETLSRRGHDVTLFEREEQLGGQTRILTRQPGRTRYEVVVLDLTTHVRRLGVDVRLGHEVSASDLVSLAPHGVVLATGARPDTSGFSAVAPLARVLPGSARDNVVTVWDALLDARPIGRRVLLLDDLGTRYSAGTAEYLLDRGHDVEVLTRHSALFPGTSGTLDQGELYSRLFAKGLRYRLNEWVRSIDPGGATAYNLYTGAEYTIDGIDTVVLGTGRHSDDRLHRELDGRLTNVHRIGDCAAPRRIDHAIYEGFLAGLELFDPTERYLVEGDLEAWALEARTVTA